jgi:class 3 adenylate cyclase/tetratricopeptide (TPR) repeat protein
VRVCASCGEENPDRARFCLACAAPLAEPARNREERKTVSVLFVDLVGFTATSDHVDPEDVRAVLRPYHTRLKEEISRFGGTVEKFIGDAVMAVFGAPVAHEDDAERAVRAGFRILEAIDELRDGGLELSVRAAVNTGEALVVLSARPDQGEGMVTGDVVNTASRLQGAAPVGGLVVGELTVRASKDTIVYEPLEPVTVKGKSEPVKLWRAVAARSRFGSDVDTRPRLALVGRERELALLQDAYGRAIHEAVPQLVTVVGESGIGKSRLVNELFAFVDSEPDLISWRQGRCLPYGEGVSLWALGEVVKAHGGILESDSPEQASEKLSIVLEPLTADVSERSWLQSRVGVLVGAESTTDGAAEREEFFTAWSRFFEAIAAAGPLVLVVEDLHWADDVVLDFLEHLVGWVTDVPLLVVCTARPELYETRRTWAGGLRNATTISLAPLLPNETSRLVTALLDQHAVPAELVEAVLERSGGNPLYAEEFIRMLEDRSLLRREGRTLGLTLDGDLPLPESVAALVAARLDTLSAERKALLQDAAVIGRVFWAGALQEMGDREARSVVDDLSELARKELVRRARSSSVQGDSEYAFWHALVRDVAYAQIPREARAMSHLKAARWIERMSGDRLMDHAELLVHHYEQALSLSQAGAQTLVGEIELALRRVLLLAGERAFAVDYARADAFFRRAMELTAEDDPDRAGVLLKLAETTELAGAGEEARRLCQEAVEAHRQRGDVLGQARALNQLARECAHAGLLAEAEDAIDTALQLLEPGPAGAELVRAYTIRTWISLFQGRLAGTVELADRAVALAQDLGLEDEEARCYGYRGMTRFWSGDRAGIEDVETAVERLRELGNWEQLAIARVNLADCRWMAEGPASGLEHCAASIKVAEQRGAVQEAMWARAETLRMLFELGRWEETLHTADRLAQWATEHRVTPVGIVASTYASFIHARTGASSVATGLLPELLEAARSVDDEQLLVPALLAAALTELGGGDRRAASLLVEEAAARSPYWRSHFAAEAARIAVDAGRPEVAENYLDNLLPKLRRHELSVLTGRAALAEAEGEFAEAADRYGQAASGWSEYGFILEHGQALLRRGRCLLRLEQQSEALASIAASRALFDELGASPLIVESDVLLGEAAARTA